jgi:GntR family transcriptional regulator
MLNSESPVPLYHQLADIILAKIRSGEYQPGSRIPSEHNLAAEYGIGRPTARQATDLLVRKRMLQRKRGSGTFVQPDKQEVDLLSLAGTISSFQQKGITIQTQILQKTRMRSIETGSESPFSGKKAYLFSRLSSVEETPVLIEHIHLHPELFEGIDRFDQPDLSISQIVEDHYYMRPINGKQNFRIGLLTGKTAKHLAVSKETPVLKVTRFLNFKQAPNAIYSEILCRTDQFVFSQTIGGFSND